MRSDPLRQFVPQVMGIKQNFSVKILSNFLCDNAAYDDPHKTEAANRKRIILKMFLF